MVERGEEPMFDDESWQKYEISLREHDLQKEFGEEAVSDY